MITGPPNESRLKQSRETLNRRNTICKIIHSFLRKWGVSLRIFLWIKSNVYLGWVLITSYRKRSSKYFKYNQNMRDYSKCVPLFHYFEHLQAIHPSFVIITKPLSSKIGGIFCEGLKWMSEVFKIEAQKEFWKLAIFSKSSKHFIIELAHGKLY